MGLNFVRKLIERSEWEAFFETYEGSPELQYWGFSRSVEGNFENLPRFRFFDLCSGIPDLLDWSQVMKNAFLRRKSPDKVVRRGAVTVEFALVLPVFLTFVFGSIEFGRCMMVCDILACSARHAARAASVTGATDSSVAAAANSVVTGNNILGATTVTKVNGVVSNVSNAVAGDQISVTVSVPYASVSPFSGTFMMSRTTSLTRTVVMRHE